MNEDRLGLFDGEDEPSVEWGWKHYRKAVDYNSTLNIQEEVKANENFYIGKQWEGVQANGLPTPVVNIIKRVVGFTVANVSSENIKITVSPLASFPEDDKLVDPVRIINEEFETLCEQIGLTKLTKEFTRDAAVRGDGCIYTWWDENESAGPAAKKLKGRIRSEIVKNTRVYFGNPNDNDVQDQPWIMIERRELIRNAKRRAKKYGAENWQQIKPDDEIDTATDTQKQTDDKVTTVQLFWKDDDSGEVWCYEFCHNVEIRKPYNLNIRLYPLVWLNWDYVADCYHGQAMITGLIPNQIFINKAWAMSMVSITRMAYPKFIYDKTRISHLDNGVGRAIGVNGNVDGAIKVTETGHIDPNVAQYINEIMQQTEESLGATEAALGEGKAYNTSAILSLQKASSTPHEITKQNRNDQLEALSRIWLEFMGENYGTRTVDMPITDELRTRVFEPYIALMEQQGLPAPEIPKTVPVDFDFSMLKDHLFSVKVDVGSSSYYSETASLETLGNLLTQGLITPVMYLEHLPDSAIAGRRKLIEDLKQQEEEQQRLAEQQAQMEQMAAMQQAPAEGAGAEIVENETTAERRATGFKELGEALRSVERRQAQQ